MIFSVIYRESDGAVKALNQIAVSKDSDYDFEFWGPTSYDNKLYMKARINKGDTVGQTSVTLTTWKDLPEPVKATFMIYGQLNS